MTGWILPLAVSLPTLLGVDAQPSDGIVPGPDATAEPTADAGQPDPLPEPEPAPVATAEPIAQPQPEPEPEPEPTPAPASDEERAPTAASRMPASKADNDSPVMRHEAGQWGMQFIFGGLAPMSIAGTSTQNVNRLVFSSLGFRRVLDNADITIPFSIGAGVFNHNPDEGSNQNDVGLAGSVGLQKQFRVWRRIAPYVGGDFRLSYLDPTGDNNWLVGVGIGPSLGIQYFLGHRVSLLMQGDATLGFNVFDGLVQTRFATQISAGGQTSLAFYF